MTLLTVDAVHDAIGALLAAENTEVRDFHPSLTMTQIKHSLVA